MADNFLTNSIIAKESLDILENNLGVLGTFYRAYEKEYDNNLNGYKPGASISIRRPADYTVRSGLTMDTQDSIEGSISFTVDTVKGVDLKFNETDRTLKVTEFRTRFLEPAILSLVNEVAMDCMEQFYPYVYNWVGTPGQVVNSFADFYKAPERLNEMAVADADRMAVLSPADEAGMLGSQTGLYISGAANDAYRNGNLGMIGGVKTMRSNLVPTHTNGTADNTTPLIRGASQNVTFDTAKSGWTQTLSTDGWDSAATITAGTVFTIADVYMVNPRTKRSTGILQQFVVTTATTAHVTTSSETPLTISPPIITSGPHQTVNAAPANDAAITVLGSASTSYKQNLVYKKEAFALCVLPMENPPEGTTKAERITSEGLSLSLVPVFEPITRRSSYRLDILYGRKCIDPRLATRLSGT